MEQAGSTSHGEGEALVNALRDAPGGTDVIAVLWTWLEGHLLELGSLREKPHRIRVKAKDSGLRFEGINDELLNWLRKSPLRNAAELLARIDLTYGKAEAGVMAASSGFDGTAVVVAWRRTDLVRLTSDHEGPPSADESPSLSTLAPSLVVSPLVTGGIELILGKLTGHEGQMVRNSLELALKGEPEPLEIHLDSLAMSGLPVEWKPDMIMELGALVEAIDAERQKETEAAVREAIKAAAGSSRILIMPELAASEETIAVIAEQLEELDGDGPALTVIGRYHRVGAEPDGEESELTRGVELGRYVNEAVIFGPFGRVLWEHRKFTSAGGDVESPDGEQYLVEDIRLGRELTVVDTPLGTVAVSICLDTFAAHGRERLERSPANILLVPSLSPSVKRHRSALGLLVQALWGLAFVCNRWVASDGGKSNWDDDKNRSFWAEQRAAVVTDPTRTENGRPSFVISL